jgi:branched-chain amino acid transport system ATP-binding protein
VLLNPLLSISGVDVHYRDFQALFQVNVEVWEGEVATLIGANAAGKSTLLKTVAAVVNPSSGTISFCGKDIGTWKPHQVVAEGISLVPEGRRIFNSMTVSDNLMVGAYSRRSREMINSQLETVYHLFPILRERRRQTGKDLSGGEQQMLAIGRSLMSNPKLMLLDEISHGLAPLVVKNIYKTVQAIGRKGTSVLFVEQDVKISLKTAQRVYAMIKGRAVSLGEPSSLSEDEVKRAYFGL